jgi:hypothetical protein
MFKFNLFLTVFLVIWGVFGAITYLCCPFIPEIAESRTKELEVNVKARSSYCLLALTKGSNFVEGTIETNNVIFRWKETGADASNDVRVTGSTFLTKQSRDGQIFRSAKAILNFTPNKSAELVILAENPGSFTLGVLPGFGPFIVAVMGTFVGALLATMLVLRVMRARKKLDAKV